jgi:hypothetical protein
MLKKILIVLIIVLIALGVLIARQPSEFRYGSSMKMTASPEKIFAQVNDFHNWQKWSPWAPLDPDAKITFEGPQAGRDAVFRWNGNSKVGAGNMTITATRPNLWVMYRLEFLKPMHAVNMTEFNFRLIGNNQTLVTWVMWGHANFMNKAIGLLMNCRKMTEGMFNQGLGNLKKIVETPR